MGDLIEHRAAELPAETPTPTRGPTQGQMMLVQALERGVDAEQLDKLMAIQERWDANEARRAFSASMAAFRAEAPVIEKNSKVDFTGKGGTRTAYAHSTLDHITAKVNPILGRHGLTFCWVTEQREGVITVHCDVSHVQGHSQRTTLHGPRDDSGNKNTIQGIGSTVTYLSRYTLMSALGLSSGGEDDDGQNAGGNDPKTDPETGKPEIITAEQAAEIKGLLQQTKSDTRAFLNAMGGSASVDELPASIYQRAIMALNKKARAQANAS